jgi:hypothetical protein
MVGKTLRTGHDDVAPVRNEIRDRASESPKVWNVLQYVRDERRADPQRLNPLDRGVRAEIAYDVDAWSRFQVGVPYLAAAQQRGKHELVDMRLRLRAELRRGRADVQEREQISVGNVRELLRDPVSLLHEHRRAQVYGVRLAERRDPLESCRTPTAGADGSYGRRMLHKAALGWGCLGYEQATVRWMQMPADTSSIPDPQRTQQHGRNAGGVRQSRGRGPHGRRRRWTLAVIACAVAIAAALVIATSRRPAPQPVAQRLFAPSSVWNAPLSRNTPLDRNSATYVADLLRQVAQYGPWFNTTQYSVPLYTVRRNQATVRVALDPAAGSQPDLQKAWTSVPLPPNAEPASGSDGAMVVWQPSTDKMWEFWQLQRGANGWQARWGGFMSSVSTNPGYYLGHSNWGSSATSLPAAAGLVRISELRAGRIDHALSLGLPETSSLVYSWPAERTDGNIASTEAIPEGTRFRLDPSLDIAKLHLPPFTRILAEAAQRYGVIVHDRASLVVMWGEDPTGYSSNPYLGPKGFFGAQSITSLMEQFPWSHLEAIRTELHRVSP